MRRFIVALLSVFLVAGPAWLGAQSKPKDQKATQTQTSTDTSSSNKVHGKLDINTATKEQLEALPGIGAAYSQKIIDGRPYKSKDELMKKKVIPASTYQKIKDEIVAHQTK